jgi:hypothetical protein
MRTQTALSLMSHRNLFFKISSENLKLKSVNALEYLGAGNSALSLRNL